MHASAVSKYQGIVGATLILLLGTFSPMRAQVSSARALPLPGESWQLEGHWAFLILPDRAGKPGPTPWVWYAPHLDPDLPGDAEKWMFERFIVAGIAVAGIDVGESYGGPAGREIYSTLYHALVETTSLCAPADLSRQKPWRPNGLELGDRQSAECGRLRRNLSSM